MEDDIADILGGSKASGFIKLMMAKKKGMKPEDYAPEKKAREKKSKKYQVCKQDFMSANVLKRFANKKLQKNAGFPTEVEQWLYERGNNYLTKTKDGKKYKGEQKLPIIKFPDECSDEEEEKPKEEPKEERQKKIEEENTKKYFDDRFKATVIPYVNAFNSYNDKEYWKKVSSKEKKDFCGIYNTIKAFIDREDWITNSFGSDAFDKFDKIWKDKVISDHLIKYYERYCKDGARKSKEEPKEQSVENIKVNETESKKEEPLSDISKKDFVEVLKNYNKEGDLLDFYYNPNDIIGSLFTLYLLRKYKNDCYIISGFNKGDNKIEFRAGLEINSKIFSQDPEFKEISSEKVSMIGEQISDCIADGIKIIIIPFRFTIGREGHFNLLVYRVDTNVLERFEPHGSLADLTDTAEGDKKAEESMTKVLTKFLTDLSQKGFIPKDAKYVPPFESCPNIGFQRLENSEFRIKFPKAKERKELEERIANGFCQMWSMFALEMTLLYPTKTLKEVQTITMTEIKKLGKYGFLKHIVGFTKEGEKELDKLIGSFKFKTYYESNTFKLRKSFEKWYNDEVLKIINTQRGKKGKLPFKTTYMIEDKLKDTLLSNEEFMKLIKEKDKLQKEYYSDEVYSNITKSKEVAKLRREVDEKIENIVMSELDKDKTTSKEDKMTFNYVDFVSELLKSLPKSGGCIRVMGESSCCGKCSTVKGGCNMCGGTKTKQDKICMTKKAYLNEHERLIKMLADTSTKTGKEAIEQADEVKKRKLKGGVLSKETKEKLAMERQAYAKDMRENPEKYVAKSFDPSEGGTKEPCSYRRALEKGGVSFGHLTSAGYQTPEDCQNIQQANINEGQRRMLENESGINKFFRGVVEGLTKVADFAVDLPFVPTIAKEGYKAFAPPTSSYYADSMTRAFSGDGKKRKMKGGRPSWAITIRKPQTREQELELEKIRNPYYGQPMVECPALPEVKSRDGVVLWKGIPAQQAEEGRCDALIRGYESALGQKQWRDDNLGVSGFVRGFTKFVQPVADVASFLPVVGSIARGISSGIDTANTLTDMAYAGNGKYKIKGKKIVILKGAGMKPEEKTFFLTAEQTYSDRPPKRIGDFLLIGDSPTIDAWLNYKTNTIMIAVRGTKDFRDVKADTSLPFNNLTNTDRYQNDRNIIASLTRTFNPSVYDYYLTGHSLGGAIISQLKRDFPFLKDAVLYNSAFQPKDLIQQSSGSIKRVYTTDDPLYNAGGKFFINSRVVPINTTAIDGILGRVIRGYKGHKLSKFRELYV